MGIFGDGYLRPGKGVSKEEAAKRNYFGIFGRKLAKMIQLNLLYLLVNLPFFAGSVLLWISYPADTLSLLIEGKILLPPVLPFLPLMLTGPFMAGLTYVMRNYARQEHAFLVSDFFEHTKSNFIQALITSILSTIIAYVLCTAFLFYLHYFLANGVPLIVFIVLAFLFIGMAISASFYIYPIMVTFKMKLWQIYKNAWIFAFAKLPQNLMILLLIGAVHVFLFNYLTFVWVVLMILILISWSSYTINYYVWHIIDKYMMSQLPKEEDNPSEDKTI